MNIFIYCLGGMTLLIAQTAAAIDLNLETIQLRQVKQERIFDAVVEAVHQSTVSSQLVGRVIEINYDVDDFVPKGSVILRLRDTELRARVEQAKAGLEESRVGLKKAEDEFVRIKDIYAKKLVAKAEFDKAEANKQSAKARVDVAAAKLNEANELLDQAVIRAPYSGYVTKRHIELGETVAVGQALMTGFSYEHLRATTEIPQAFVESVREHAEARVLLDEGQKIEAESIRVFPYADEKSHAFKVRINLPQGDYGLYPGMFVKVAFVTGEVGRLLMPVSALVRRSELTGVYVLKEDGRISLRQVRVGRRYADQLEVLAGLEAGEKVAIDPIAAGIKFKQQR